MSTSAEKPKPRIGCATMVTDERGYLLLGCRAKEPFRGKWIIPGGGVKFLETMQDAAKREILEELSVSISSLKFFDLVEIIDPPAEHRIVIYFTATATGGEVSASSDLSDARYFSRGEVESGIQEGKFTPTVADVLKKWLSAHAR